jgi:hypothetical protein
VVAKSKACLSTSYDYSMNMFMHACRLTSCSLAGGNWIIRQAMPCCVLWARSK